MNWDIASKIVPAALGVLTAVLQVVRVRTGRRAQLKANLELFVALPEESSAREKLLAQIDAEVERLIVDDSTKRRDPTGIALGIVLVALGIGLAVVGHSAGGWWNFLWVATVALVLLGAVGFAQDVTPHVRDEKGRPVDR